MRSLIRAFVVLVLGLTTVVAAIVIWYMAQFPSYTHHYRLLIELEKDGRRHSGSGVIEVTWKSQPALGPPWHCVIRGDAVPIDIGDARVIALLDRGNTSIPAGMPCWLALQAYGLGGQSHASLVELSKKHGRVEVPSSQYPAFAIFKDENRPSTAIAIQPDEFPAALRANILGVWLELTDAPVTRGVVTKIPAVKRLVAISKASGGLEDRRPGVFEPFASHFTRD